MTHEELLAAIGAALGEVQPYAEQIAERDQVIFLGNGTSPPISRSREILGGAIGPEGRVGWIEQRSEPPVDGHVPVEIDVRVVVDGRLRISTLETYNPYFGCSVRFAAWVADGFVFVYSEKHRTILARFAAPFHEQQLVALHDEPTIIDERLVHRDHYQGILHIRRLADLRPGIAVLIPRTPKGSTLQSCRTIPLPPDELLPPAQQLRKRWLGLLGRVPHAQLVVDTLGEPWLQPAEPTSVYGFANKNYTFAGRRLPKPVREALPKSQRIYGWPSEGSFEERLDQVFLSAVGRAAL